MSTSTRLAVLSLVVALGAVAAYALLLRVALVRNHPEGYVIAFALATALAALAVVRARGRRWPAWLALGLSSLLLVAGAWFNFVAARVPDAPTALRVGEQPPDFTLPDAAGRAVSLADYRGKKPVVLVFYRGYWWPFCIAELQGLGAHLSEAERAGVEIIAVSPDPNERSQKVAEGLRLGYRFLADRDLAVTRRYGLVHASGGADGQDVPRPATVVLDRDGVVRWFSVSRNFQVRPGPDDVLRAVRAL